MNHSHHHNANKSHTVRHYLGYFHSIKVRLLFRMLMLFFAIFCFGMIGMVIFEFQHNEDFSDIFDIIYFVITTMSTVGFGDKVPLSMGGKIVIITLILASMMFVTLFSAIIAALFIESKLKEEVGMKHYNFSKHLVIIGWNQKGKKIIDLLRENEFYEDKNIVILAPEDKKPLDETYVYFCRSHLTIYADDVAKSALSKASAILLLASYEVKVSADAITTVNCLLARKNNPQARIIAEMLDPSSREYLELAGADTIIGVGEIGGYLMAEACIGNTKLQDMFDDFAPFENKRMLN